MIHRFATSALEEYAVILNWYEKVQEGLGAEIYDDIERTIERAKRNPEAFKRFGGNQRKIQCRTFQVGLVFEVVEDIFYVTQIMDLRTDPESWRDLQK